MVYFEYSSVIIIPLLLLDHSCTSSAVTRYRTHLEHSRYKRNTLESFDCGRLIERKGIDFINYGIQKIYRDLENKTIQIKHNFYDTLHELYKLSGTHPGVRQLVMKELYTYRKHIKENAFEKYASFYEGCIHFYTTFYAYRRINECLRAHQCNTKEKLTTNEKHLAPYSAVLMSVLLYWDELNKETGITYRGLNLTQNEIDEFTKGLYFTWPSFISSSRIEAGASKKYFTCKFVFENSEDTLWRPRYIAKFAHDVDQQESLYPPGAQFKVMKKHEDKYGLTTINLKLVSSITESNQDAVTATRECRYWKILLLTALAQLFGGVFGYVCVLRVTEETMILTVLGVFIFQLIINISFSVGTLILVLDTAGLGKRCSAGNNFATFISSLVWSLLLTVYFTFKYYRDFRVVFDIDIPLLNEMVDRNRRFLPGLGFMIIFPQL